MIDGTLTQRLCSLVEYRCNVGHVHVVRAWVAVRDGWTLAHYVESVRAVAPNAAAVTFV